MRFLFILSCLVGLGACAVESGDDSMYLTGTEEYAVRTVDGEYVCEAPKKVLICHIPPGNPENAHTICVSANAVDTHQEHHGDLIGPCEGEVVEPPPDEDPPSDEDPPDEDPPPPDVPEID